MKNERFVLSRRHIGELQKENLLCHSITFEKKSSSVKSISLPVWNLACFFTFSALIVGGENCSGDREMHLYVLRVLHC